MFEDEKKILSVEELKTHWTGYKIDAFDILVPVLPPLVMLVIAVVVAALTPKAIRNGGELAGIACGLVFLMFATVFVLSAVNAFEMLRMLRQRPELPDVDLVEAKVISTSRSEEIEYFGGHSGRKYHKCVTYYYMSFKDYGEVRCGSYVREGDLFYLAINKKDNTILKVYSPAEYRIKR